MANVKLSKSERIIRSLIQHYNSSRYWKYRSKVINSGGFNYLRLLYIKKCDAFNKASLGTHIGFGAHFGSIPNFPHGLYGIIVTHNAIIGSDCTIYHNVTIGEGSGGAPKIGNNVLIGAGAIIIGKIEIGNNVKIGAGCIVTMDIPDNATVVMEKPRIIVKDT